MKRLKTEIDRAAGRYRRYWVDEHGRRIETVTDEPLTLANDAEERQRRGIDGDLVDCLDNNPQDFGLEDIVKVWAVWEGANDGDDWRWVLELRGGRFVFLQGWCDYTGWDCQSGAYSVGVGSVEAALHEAVDQGEVYTSLRAQVAGHKTRTWREQIDEAWKE